MELLIYALIILFLIFFGAPIGFSLIVGSFFYVIALSPLDPIILPQKMQSGLNSFPLLAVPFFLMLGDIMARAGITERLVKLANDLVGHLRGGLAYVNIVASMLLAGVQGVATADTAAVGSMLIPAMKRDGYAPNYAAAITAASSAVGPIIPPSLTMVIYGSMGNVSIGRLFLGGAIPGILLGFYLMIYSYIHAKRSILLHSLKPEHFSASRLSQSLKSASLPLLIPLIVVGGIVGGVFTATESAAVATVAAIFIGAVCYKSLSGRAFLASALTTLYLLGSVLIIVAAAAAFGWILSIEGASALLGETLFGISKNPFVLMLVINGILLVLGCFIEPVALIILLTPILLPVVIAAGYDPVHFGVIMVLNLTIGLTTPPLGVCMFVACGIADISVDAFMKAMVPLYVPLLLGLLSVIVFPQLAMFLPNLLMGH